VNVEAFDGTIIHTTVGGRTRAPALVFAHGIIESTSVWHYQMRDPVLTDRYALIAYDARGHGRSGPARGPHGHTPFTSGSQARDMTTVIERTTTERVVLVGHSMGGIAIQALWDGERPEIVRRVAGIVLVNSTYTGELVGWRGRGTKPQRAFERLDDIGQRLISREPLVRAFRPGYSDLAFIAARVVFGKDPLPEHLDAGVRTYLATPSATIAASVDLVATDLYHVLPHIDVPALVVTGTRDRITPQWQSEEIARRIPDAELVVLADCGHMAPVERHVELNGIIAKFAERVL
jgi:pimeloyl-ACP methyl ester carboxylesterase